MRCIDPGQHGIRRDPAEHRSAQEADEESAGGCCSDRGGKVVSGPPERAESPASSFGEAVTRTLNNRVTSAPLPDAEHYKTEKHSISAGSLGEEQSLRRQSGCRAQASSR